MTIVKLYLVRKFKFKTTTAHNTTQTTGSTQAKYAFASPAVWLHVSPNRRTGSFSFLQVFEKEKENAVMACGDNQERNYGFAFLG